MRRRIELIREWNDGESMVCLAETRGVSRKTIYKWIAGHAAEGAAGLPDRSRAPLRSPQKLTGETIARILAARQRWGWGPRKLLVKMEEASGEKGPAASTVAELLRSKGLSRRPRRRVRTPLYHQPLAAVEQANQTWCATLKAGSARPTAIR